MIVKEGGYATKLFKIRTDELTHPHNEPVKNTYRTKNSQDYLGVLFVLLALVPFYHAGANQIL